MLAALIRENPSWRRRDERWRVRLGAQSLDSGPAAQSMTIFDLSSSGLLLETDQPLRTGANLIIEMPGEITKICKTVWNSGKFYGANFSEPLTDAELRNLVNSSSVVWPTFGRSLRAPSINHCADASPKNFDETYIDETEKLPLSVRLMIILGTSAALWAAIGIGVWLTFS